MISPQGQATYEACLERAEGFARGLAERGVERFAATLERPADVVAVAAGASAAGSEICVYPRDLDGPGLERLLSAFDHSVVISDGSAPESQAEVIGLGDLAVGGDPPSPSEGAPVLILTTGTTGDQKGTKHDWARLAAAVRSPDQRAGTRWLLTYNLNQFAGIQIMLHALLSGSTLVVPLSRQPQDAIDAIADHGVTHASGTPTFWRLLTGRLDHGSAAELRLEQITLGGEASDDTLLSRLAELFPKARISHVYAGSEFGSAISVRDGRAGLPLSVLDRGEDAPVQVRIVDGELELRSRVGMLGYHHDEGEAGRASPSGARPGTWSRSATSGSTSSAGARRSSTSVAPRSIRCRLRRPRARSKASRSLPPMAGPTRSPARLSPLTS